MSVLTPNVALADAGEPRPLQANQPLPLDDPDAVWLVSEGEAHVFAVATGPRSYLFTAQPGELLIGIAPRAGTGLLAAGNAATRLSRVSWSQLVSMAGDRTLLPGLVELAEKWIERLSGCLLGPCSAPGSYVGLPARGRVALTPGQVARASDGIVWLKAAMPASARLWGPCAGRARDGALGEVERGYPLPAGWFPLAQPAWLTTLDAAELTLASPAEVLGDGAGWDGLRRFNMLALSLAARGLQEAARQEQERLAHKAAYDRLALDQAYRGLAAALNDGAPREPAQAADQDPVLEACRLVGAGAGIEFMVPPASPPGHHRRDPVEAIARASRVRHRQVALNGQWWRAEHGPLLGYVGESRRPVALLPAGSHGYDLVDPTAGTRQRVTPEVADKLQPFGCVFYRPLPDAPLAPRDVLRFGARSIRPELWRMLLTGIAGGLLAMLTPILTGTLFDDLIPNANHSGVLLLALALIATALATAVFGIGRGLARTRLETRLDGELQAAVWDRLLGLPASFFRAYSAGDLGGRAMGINAMREILTGVVATTLFSAIFSVFSFALLFYYDLKLALLAVLLLGLMVGVTLLAARSLLRCQSPMMVAQNRLQGLTLQLLTGIAKLRVAGAEARAFSMWAGELGTVNDWMRKSRLIGMRLGVFYAALPLVSSMAIFAVVASSRSGSISTGAFLAFVSAFGQVTAAALALAPSITTLLRVIPLYDNSRPIFETAPEVDLAKTDPGELNGHVGVSHVDFRYRPDGPLVLQDLSFEVEAGQFMAFVGPSGSGKSTIFRLLLGFERPEAGSVHYDGQDLAGLDARAVRRQLGVVLQNGKLMPGSIYENIVGSANFTLEDAWEAARLAGFEDDVKAMPMGMQTFLTDGSGAISGGQRQRLMIARAIVGRPRILLFDEATSALDNQTQAIVSRSLEQLKATRIVIAHRLSTVMKADVICVVVAGKVVQKGAYEELLAQHGPFAELAKRQLS